MRLPLHQTSEEPTIFDPTPGPYEDYPAATRKLLESLRWTYEVKGQRPGCRYHEAMELRLTQKGHLIWFCPFPECDELDFFIQESADVTCPKCGRFPRIQETPRSAHGYYLLCPWPYHRTSLGGRGQPRGFDVLLFRKKNLRQPWSVLERPQGIIPEEALRSSLPLSSSVETLVQQHPLLLFLSALARLTLVQKKPPVFFEDLEAVLKGVPLTRVKIKSLENSWVYGSFYQDPKTKEALWLESWIDECAKEGLISVSTERPLRVSLSSRGVQKMRSEKKRLGRR